MAKVFDFFSKKETNVEEVERQEEYFISSLQDALSYVGVGLVPVGERIKDECLTPKQRALVDSIKAAKRTK
jgi:hypothetical protein